MKKLLLIGMILAILILAMPQGVMAADDDAVVTATVADVSVVNVAPVAAWELDRGTANLNTDAISVTVDSTSPWGLTVQDTKETNAGFMVGNDDPKTPLDAGFVFEGFEPGTLNAEQTLFDPGQIPQVENTESPYLYDIDQDVSNEDDSSLTYQITLTFTLTSA
jgi:hypothetical protein